MTGRHLAEHYAAGDLLTRLKSALAAAGLDRPGISPTAIALVDQFHSRGRAATLELAELAGIRGQLRVLDLGCGIGGPARTLAAEFGCGVIGLDLMADYCRAAAYLSRLTGLYSRTQFVCASALAVPFADASFDLLWTQHAQMNIADKSALYGECARLLAPGGRLALYDVLAGKGGPPIFPVPWAGDPGSSFLVSPSELEAEITRAGFRILAWEDRTAAVAAWARESMEKRNARAAAADLPAVGLQLLLGPDFPAMADNYALSLAEGRVEVIAAVAEKR